MASNGSGKGSIPCVASSIVMPPPFSIEALELLACAGALDLATLVALVGADVVERLERSGLLVAGEAARLGQPQPGLGERGDFSHPGDQFGVFDISGRIDIQAQSVACVHKSLHPKMPKVKKSFFQTRFTYQAETT